MCGIFGLINSDHSTFNKGIFNTLGIANDSRGGDSCGVFIDGKFEYGVKDKELYRNFFLESDLIQKTSKCKIAIGHCRKKSVGTISIETAQPVIIKEGDEVKFVLMHNGTIFNYEELAKKYIPEIDIKGMTDSQVMARIFYYKGYDVLSEYNGGAVFVIIDYRKDVNNPQILFWKGASKKSTYQKEVIDERPFYFFIKNGRLVFSSILEYLEGFLNETCYTIHENTLIEYKHEQIYKYKEFSRDKCQQDKEYKSSSTIKSTTYNSQSNYSGWGNGNYIYTGKYGEYMLKGKNLHGETFCSAYGIVFDTPFVSSNSQYFYFYNGVLLHDKESFELLEKIRNGFAETIADYSDYKLFCRDYPEIIASLSYGPLMMDESKTYLTADSNLMWEKFNGEFRTVFADFGIKTCKDGKVISNTYTNAISSYESFKAAASAFYLNKEAFIDLINNNYGIDIRL